MGPTERKDDIFKEVVKRVDILHGSHNDFLSKLHDKKRGIKSTQIGALIYYLIDRGIISVDEEFLK